MNLSHKLILPGLALAATALAAPAAIAEVAIAAGVKVTDTSGAEVGTVTKVEGANLLLKTDKHEVRLPVSSFAKGDSSLLFALSRDQLNAEVEKALAAANAKIVAGAEVKGAQGAAVGTIEAVDDQFVTLKLSSGSLIRLPRASVAAGPDGVVTGITAAELESLAAAAAQNSGATSSQ